MKKNSLLLSLITCAMVALLLSACGNSTTTTPPSSPTMMESPKPPLPVRILRAGEANGNRFFTTEQGAKLFSGATYFNAHEFFKGYCVVTKKEGDKELHGVINAKGEVVVPITHPESIRDYDHGYFNIGSPKIGYLDSTCKLAIPMEYSNSKGFVDGMFILEKGYGKWGILNAKAEVVLPFEYNKIASFNNGLAPVKKGNKWGIVDHTGKLAIPLNYESLTGFDHNVCLAQKGKKYGLIDAQNTPITEFIYDAFKWEVESVKSEVTETGYADVGQSFVTEGGYIVVSKGKFWGAIDPAGAEVIPFEFDYVGGKDAAGVNVGNGQKRGVYDIEKKTVKWFGEGK